MLEFSRRWRIRRRKFRRIFIIHKSFNYFFFFRLRIRWVQNTVTLIKINRSDVWVGARAVMCLCGSADDSFVSGTEHDCIRTMRWFCYSTVWPERANAIIMLVFVCCSPCVESALFSFLSLRCWIQFRCLDHYRGTPYTFLLLYLTANHDEFICDWLRVCVCAMY